MRDTWHSTMQWVGVGRIGSRAQSEADDDAAARLWTCVNPNLNPPFGTPSPLSSRILVAGDPCDVR